MATQQCPHCGLWNSASARRCDCGYAFGLGGNTLPARARRPPLSGRFVLAVLLSLPVLLLGLLLLAWEFFGNVGFQGLVLNVFSASALLAIPALIFFWVAKGLSAEARAHRLAREGQLLKGTVVRCTVKWVFVSVGEYGGAEVPQVCWQYVFTTPAGEKIEAYKEWYLSPEAHQKFSSPAPGTPVTVQYVNENLYELL